MQYRTAEIARKASVHPNTVRFYEEVGLLPPVPRSENGYRLYDDSHLLYLSLIRIAFRQEVLGSSGALRNQVLAMLKTAATGDMAGAIEETAAYHAALEAELSRAEEAIEIIEALRGNPQTPSGDTVTGRRAAAEALGVTMDVLRDWERNGLADIEPDAEGKRQYGPEMNRLKIVRVLRGANYSTMAILRMLTQLDAEPDIDIWASLDTPGAEEGIARAADRYLSALQAAIVDTGEILSILQRLQKT